MTPPPHHPRDPLGWCVAIALVFLALILIRLGTPTKPYFDEIHYLPAARGLLSGKEWLNKEHPMLGKEALALAMTLFGDNPFGWRILSALSGAATLFACMRALWFASCSRFATLAYGVLLATGFSLFVSSRIAMLDPYMLVFAALAYWQLAAACREPEHGRVRLAIAGVCLGLSMGAKWNVLPLAILPGLAFLCLRLRSAGWRGLMGHRGAPVPGIRLAEAALWLGLLPLLVYWLTYLPGYWLDPKLMHERGFIGLHQKMLQMQDSVVKHHPYMSTWRQWVIDWRPIWYFYEKWQGAQRGTLMLGNPLTMLAGLPAVAWALWAGLRGRRDALAVALIYLAALAMWVVADKPVQFYYHYTLPSLALLAALALAIDAWWRRGWRTAALLFLAASFGLFAWFYPILSAAALSGGRSAFEKWMWLNSWR
jgi:dolichyl-phosphate-mannose--protein O-mannosyl transferase